MRFFKYLKSFFLIFSEIINLHYKRIKIDTDEF